MSSRGCLIYGCKNYEKKGQKEKSVSYHKVPTANPEIRAEWIRLINRGPDFEPGRSNYVCSDHFSVDDFVNNPNHERIKLKPTAKPSIFPKIPDNVIFGPRKQMIYVNVKPPGPTASVNKCNENLDSTQKLRYASKPISKVKKEYSDILKDLSEDDSDFEELNFKQAIQAKKNSKREKKQKESSTKSDDIISDSEDISGCSEDEDKTFELKKKKKNSAGPEETIYKSKNCNISSKPIISKNISYSNSKSLKAARIVKKYGKTYEINRKRKITSSDKELPGPVEPLPRDLLQDVQNIDYTEESNNTLENNMPKRKNIVQSCVIFNCENHDLGTKGKSGISFFKFPSKKYQPELRKIWVRNVRYQEWEPSESMTVCSLHFAPECFRITIEKKDYLKENACPTIFNHEGPTAQTVKLEQRHYFATQGMKRKSKFENSEVELVKTTFNLKTEHLPKFLENDCCVPLKDLEVLPSKFSQLFDGFLCGLEVPPMSLLPGIPRKLVDKRPNSSPKRLLNTEPQVQIPMPPQHSHDKENMMLNKMRYIVNTDHNYKYPTFEELILKNNALTMDLKKKQQEIDNSRKVRADMRLTITKLKRKVEKLENQIKKCRPESNKNNDIQSRIQRVLSKQQMPIPSNVLNSISIPQNIPERPPWMAPLAPTKPPSEPKMISRKCQTRLKDFKAKFDSDINVSDDEMIELLPRKEQIRKDKEREYERRHVEKRKRGLESWEEDKKLKRREERKKRKQRLEQRRKESHERYLKFQQHLLRRDEFDNGDNIQIPRSSNLDTDPNPHECNDTLVKMETNSEMQNKGKEAKFMADINESDFSIVDTEAVPDNPGNVDILPTEGQRPGLQHHDDHVDDNMEEAFKIEEALKHIMSPVKGD